MTRCLLIENNLPKFLSAALINNSAYTSILNHCQTSVIKNKTFEEIWLNKIPNVNHFRQIGCGAFALNKKPDRSKLDPKSEEFILIGYSKELKGYKLWKKGTKQVIKSRDVFSEDTNVKDKCELNDNRFEEFEL